MRRLRAKTRGSPIANREEKTEGRLREIRVHDGVDARKPNRDRPNNLRMGTTRDGKHGFATESRRGHGFTDVTPIRAVPVTSCKICKISETNTDCGGEDLQKTGLHCVCETEMEI